MQDTAIQIIDLTKFYYLIGGLIVANLGTLATVAGFFIKSSIKITRYFADLENAVKENVKDIDAAHKAIRDTNKRVDNLYQKTN